MIFFHSRRTYSSFFFSLSRSFFLSLIRFLSVVFNFCNLRLRAYYSIPPSCGYSSSTRHLFFRGALYARCNTTARINCTHYRNNRFSRNTYPWVFYFFFRSSPPLIFIKAYECIINDRRRRKKGIVLQYETFSLVRTLAERFAFIANWQFLRVPTTNGNYCAPCEKARQNVFVYLTPRPPPLFPTRQ